MNGAVPPLEVSGTVVEGAVPPLEVSGTVVDGSSATLGSKWHYRVHPWRWNIVVATLVGRVVHPWIWCFGGKKENIKYSPASVVVIAMLVPREQRARRKV